MDWQKLQSIDRRIIYVLLILVAAIPMINPLGIPLSVGRGTQKFFEIMDAIPAGERVLFSIDYAPSGAPDVHPQTTAVMQHMVDKGIGVVTISFWEAGAMFGDGLIRHYEEQGLEYGVHFANLGYLPGGTTAIKRFGEDVMGSVEKDFRDNVPGTLPIMQGIKDTRDFAAVICFAAGDPGVSAWVSQVQGPLDINFLAAVVTVEVPGVTPFVTSGQIKALLGGLRGAAEYELVSGKPGASAAKMDAQSLGHLLIIAFILVGNLAYFMDQRKA